jgi:hypothetical protein
MFHRLIGALLGGAALLGLTGCAPEPDPYSALAMVDDRPTLLIAECARSGIGYVTLWERASAASPVPATIPPRYPEWSVESPRSTPGPNGIRRSTEDAPARLTFFEKPSDWLISKETLRAFREDAEYHVHGGLGNVASLEFTLARLRELAPGEVLTAVGYRDQHVVSEAEFEEAAQKVCDGP